VVPNRYQVEAGGVAVAPELSQFVELDILLAGMGTEFENGHY
jgi:hypothetical protein